MTNQLPFAKLEATYVQLTAWCDVLEAVADFLPCHIDEALCENIAMNLMPLLHECHLMEEKMISPMLSTIFSETDQSCVQEKRQMSRMCSKQAARDITILLKEMASGRRHLTWDAAGCVLRSFLCVMRKHMKVERQLIDRLRARLLHSALVVAPAAATEAA